MHHLELFSQFVLDTAPSIYDGSVDNPTFRAVMPVALSAPFVMYQMLALSALHLSHTRTAQASHYREEATFLQTEALSQFNGSWANKITTENCESTLVFSSLLSVHALGEAVTVSETDGGGFLSRFVVNLNLHQGVRTVVHESWQMLSQSNISSTFDRAERSLHTTSLQSQEQATFVADRLHSLLNDADLGPKSEQACREAVVNLQLVYQSESLIGEPPPEKAPGLVWTWPIVLSGVFTDLLMKRSPEALVILCHYAVLLHRRRHIWLVRNAGQMLISEITRSLGTYWSGWLDWPNQMLPYLL